jgi:predicted transcriptional regulator
LKRRGTEDAEDFVHDYDLWFKTEVEKGLAQLEKGEFLEYEEVIAHIEQVLHSKKRSSE